MMVELSEAAELSSVVFDGEKLKVKGQLDPNEPEISYEKGTENGSNSTSDEVILRLNGLDCKTLSITGIKEKLTIQLFGENNIGQLDIKLKTADCDIFFTGDGILNIKKEPGTGLLKLNASNRKLIIHFHPDVVVKCEGGIVMDKNATGEWLTVEKGYLMQDSLGDRLNMSLSEEPYLLDESLFRDEDDFYDIFSYGLCFFEKDGYIYCADPDDHVDDENGSEKVCDTVEMSRYDAVSKKYVTDDNIAIPEGARASEYLAQLGFVDVTGQVYTMVYSGSLQQMLQFAPYDEYIYRAGQVIAPYNYKYRVLSDVKRESGERAKLEFAGVVKDVAKVKILKNICLPGDIMGDIIGISDGALSGSKKLKKLIIDSNVEYIGEAAFKNCKKLEYIELSNKKLTSQSIGKGAFDGITGKVKIVTSKKNIKRYVKIFGNIDLGFEYEITNK